MKRPPSAILVAVLAFAAYLPALGGGFLELDDLRFVRDNEAIHSLGPGRVARFFTDPRTVSEKGWQGIYRPLRTLDFAIDWAISGGAAWFFHLRNVLYHVLAALLLFRLLSHLTGEGKGPALAGALVFAVHPVQVESVAWITSRGDVLLGCLFLGGLLFHVRGKYPIAALLLAGGVLAKEAAVVFPGAALLLDLHLRRRPRWGWFAVYGLITAGYALAWHAWIAGGGMGHRSEWWGGSYPANLATMARALLGYAGLLLFPVRQAVGYHVPAVSGLDAGAVLGTGLAGALLLAAARGGRDTRLSLGLAFLTLLPTSNLLFTVGIPSAERFLYLPLAGLALVAGRILSGRRLAPVVLGCFLVLSFARAGAWRSDEALFTANERAATTRSALYHRAIRALDRAHEALAAADNRRMAAEAEEVLRLSDRFFRLHREEIGGSPGLLGGLMLVKRANALLLLERNREALRVARRSAELGGGADAEFNMGAALDRMGEPAESLRHFEKAVRLGYRDPALRGPVARALVRLGARYEEEGDRMRAGDCYRRAWSLWPDPVANRDARLGLIRLGE